MRWIAHILTVFAVIGCLVGAGQARADYVTHTECKNSQSTSTAEYVSAALAPIVVGVDRVSIQQPSDQTSESELSKAKHCSYCWANLPLPVGGVIPPEEVSLLDWTDHRSDSLPVAGLDRPPKLLHI
ncbi:hypothetical protein [Cohaesibacter gelatinilyticus]|uniref:DUF2946 domain-containing protein n=1 Tax=Cohaesibacter gelatinilyticus TaxID=372072 RepID=A0A285PG28_9HYPH|nr:hypothetical protein [Cohaesibacter gelatinilyticus]SNZ20243.1 hypothetical protein SAMN06265368_3346 [Cohaesibacter gelatinilyticus]